MVRSVWGILLCAFLAAAQPAPSGRQILNHVVAAYKAVPGYELEAKISNQTAGGAPQQTTIDLAYGAPDRLMFEDKSTNHFTSFHDHGMATFNGARGGFMSPAPKPVVPKEQLAAEAERRRQALVKIGFTDYTMIEKGLESARVFRQEDVTVGGDSIPCSVVEATYSHNLKRTFWVDPMRYNVLREVDVDPAREHTIEIVKLSWGERPPDSQFEIEKNIRTAGNVGPRRLRGPRCEVTTPEARIARLSGMAMVRVTVDAQGEVTDAHSMQPLGLGVDELVVECVRQTSFRPAERDGKAAAGASEVGIGVDPLRHDSDWNLTHVEFHPPSGATRPIFQKASYPMVAGAIGQALFHLSAVVDTKGIPQNVEVTGPDSPKLKKQAIAIVSSYRFKPGELDGQPVEAPAKFDLEIGSGWFTTTSSSNQPACDLTTQETQTARLNGKISLSFVVDPQGQASDIQVVQGLGLGTDEKAVECVAHGLQNPHRRDGSAFTGKTTAAIYLRADISYSDWTLGHAAFEVPAGTSPPVFLKTTWPSPGKHTNGSFRPAVIHLSLTIDKSGVPRNVAVTGSDYPMANKQAVEIVKSWRFRPAQLDGQPIDTSANFDIVVNWMLRAGE